MAKKHRRIRLDKKFWLGIVLLLVLTGTVFGKYIYNEVRDFYLASKNFYFSSSKMSATGISFQLDNWSGALGDTFTIPFDVNSYLNNAVFSESDITYDISYTCSSNVSCTISQTSGVIYASSHTDTFNITILANQSLSDGDLVTINVTASATSPYTKTITGTYVIKIGKMGLSYSIDDVPGRPYFTLNITNTLDYYVVRTAFSSYSVNDRIDEETYRSLSDSDKEKCSSVIMHLSFDPSEVLLDMTTPVYLRRTSETTTRYDGYNYINGITFEIEALSSEIVKFYKQNAALDYTYPFGTTSPIVTISYS